MNLVKKYKNSCITNKVNLTYPQQLNYKPIYCDSTNNWSNITQLITSDYLGWVMNINSREYKEFCGIAKSIENGVGYIYSVGWINVDEVNNKTCIIKTTLDGSIVWQKKLENENYNYFYNVCTNIENNNTYIYCVGQEYSSDEGYNTIIIKFNSSGNIVWQKKLGGSGNDRFNSVCVSIEDENTYIYCVGHTRSSIENWDALIAKLDSSGNLVWQKRLGGNKDDIFYNVCVSVENNNTYVYCVGYEWSSGVEANALVVKFNSFGDIIWQKKLGGNGRDYFRSVCVSIEDDKPYIYCVGYENSSTRKNHNAIIVKLDYLGDTIWQKKLRGNIPGMFYDVCLSIENNNTYIYCVGRECSNIENYESIIVKFNTSGNLVWQKKLAGLNNYFNGVCTSVENNNTYVYCVGYKTSSIKENSEAIIAKFNSTGVIEVGPLVGVPQLSLSELSSALSSLSLSIGNPDLSLSTSSLTLSNLNFTLSETSFTTTISVY